MPSFFVPAADSPEEAERVYDAVRNFVAESMGGPLDPDRIFAIRYRHDGKNYLAEVGRPDPRIGQPVVAILKESNYPLYFVCTLDRGVARGEPILVGENEVTSRIDFDRA